MFWARPTMPTNRFDPAVNDCGRTRACTVWLPQDEPAWALASLPVLDCW